MYKNISNITYIVMLILILESPLVRAQDPPSAPLNSPPPPQNGAPTNTMTPPPPVDTPARIMTSVTPPPEATTAAVTTSTVPVDIQQPPVQSPPPSSPPNGVTPPPPPTAAGPITTTSGTAPSDADVLAPPSAPIDMRVSSAGLMMGAPPPASSSGAGDGGPSETKLTQAEVVQFESWLKSNGQNLKKTPPIPPRLINKNKPVEKPFVIQTGPDAPTVESAQLTLNKSREIMLETAPPSPEPSPEANIAFNLMLQQNVPLTPQQIVKLRQWMDTSQRAASIPANVPPKPVSSTLMINLAPGATPPAIRLSQGYVSSLVFVDSAGAPWPIAAYDIGDPKATNIQWDGKSNILLIQAVQPYSDGNMVVRLVGLPTPVTLELVSGQRVVDFRTDIHVPGIGPNTTNLPIGVALPSSANQLLLSVLDGVAPPGSKELRVKGGDSQAWLLGNTMFLRTRLTVLSPGWIGKMVSPDGMIAYEMQRTSSILVSQYGNPVELRIEGF